MKITFQLEQILNISDLEVVGTKITGRLLAFVGGDFPTKTRACYCYERIVMQLPCKKMLMKQFKERISPQ